MKRLLILGLAFLAIVVVACGAPPPTPTSVPTLIPLPTAPPQPTATPSPVPTATPTAIPTPANPADALTKIFKSWGSVKSLRAKITMTGVTPAQQDMAMEVVMPDKFHMTTKDLDLYMISKVVYIKIAGKWQKMALPKGVDLDLANPAKYLETLGAQTDIKFIGADVLDGAPMLVYQYTTNIKGPPASKYSSKVWVGALDTLPRKVESEPKAGQKTTIIFYDYNANITIKAPV